MITMKELYITLETEAQYTKRKSLDDKSQSLGSDKALHNGFWVLE
jgi:hypothetical protein